MKIIVTGATGYIGSHLCKFIENHDIVRLGFTKNIQNSNSNSLNIDLLNTDSLRGTLDTIKANVVIHLAGYTNEDHSDEDKLKNFDMTYNLLENINTNDTHIIFLSTDKVFDGAKLIPTEEDVPSPCDLYGYQKLKSERLIMKRCRKYHIIRLPIVHSYGDKKSRCFIDRSIVKLKSNNKVNIFSNIERSFLKLDDLLFIISQLISDKNYGVFHAGTKMTSYLDRIYGISDTIGGIDKNNVYPCIGNVVPRKQGLNSSKIQKLLKINLE
jgi:dTDP-4-dehydrorhamnose reductase